MIDASNITELRLGRFDSSGAPSDAPHGGPEKTLRGTEMPCASHTSLAGQRQQQDRARIDAVGHDVCGAGGVCDGEEAEGEAILSSPPAEELGEPRLTQGAQSGALYGRASEGTPRGLADVAAEQKKQDVKSVKASSVKINYLRY